MSTGAFREDWQKLPASAQAVIDSWPAGGAILDRDQARTLMEGARIDLAYAPDSDDGLDDAWTAAYGLPEAQRKDGRGRRHVFLDKSVPGQWYANILHEDGYVVWYMPGDSPTHALNELVRALDERRAGAPPSASQPLAPKARAADASEGPLSLAQVKDLAAAVRAAGRTPDDLERSGQRDLLASYILRDERGTAEDIHEKRHLAAMIEVGNSGHCRGLDCVIVGGRDGDRLRLAIDVPYDGRTSDFDAAPDQPADCPDCGGQGWIAVTTADPLPSGEPGEPYQIRVGCENPIHDTEADR